MTKTQDFDRKKPKKSSKPLFIVLGVIVLVLLLALGGFWAYGAFIKPINDPVTQNFKHLAETFEEISYDEESGTPYINNEIIVIAAEGADPEEIKKLAYDLDGEIAEEMEDIGVYKIKLYDAYELSELEDMVDDLKKEETVADAFISEVTVFDSDAEESELPVASPVYPDDPWYDTSSRKASWDDTPAGSNWGVEAINAPDAWGYLDKLSTVKVGLIDSMPDISHRDLKASVKGAYAVLTDQDTGKTSAYALDTDVWAPDTHGTHVAGTMLATWNDDDISGIMGDKGELYYACAYNVVDNKVVSEYTTPFNYFRAIKMLVDQDVQAINISQNTCRLIGFAASHGNSAAITYLDGQAEQAGALIERLILDRQAEGKKDFVICVSAGNSNNTPYVVNDSAVYGYEEFDEANASHYTAELESGDSDAKYNNYLALIDNETVSDRIIVVGSVRMTGDDAYAYSSFSCVGDRVDIVAPGESILSTVPGDKTQFLNGTSMAAPHVTASAGLVFGANPELTGPEVKQIICASVQGRFYHSEDYSGLLDLNLAVRNSLTTSEGSSVGHVVHTGGSGLDLCFLIDTTGSMSDDIDNAKENMTEIIAALAEKTSDYRVALVDYRDFADRGGSQDYPAKIQFDFTNDTDEIVDGINGLTLGYGGDGPETVYSGLVTAMSLDWRPASQKVIIIIGDAAPLDPEPNTGYTYEMIEKMLYEADFDVKEVTTYGADTVSYMTDSVKASDADAVSEVGDPEKSLIRVFTIGTSASGAAEEFFEKLSLATGGAYTGIESASEVSGAIVQSIEKIEIEYVEVTLRFGEEHSGEIVNLYRDDEFYFSFTLDDSGEFKLENVEFDDYECSIDRLKKTGSFEVDKKSKKIDVELEEEWYTFALVIWYRHRTALILGVVGAIIALILLIVAIRAIVKAAKRASAKRAQQRFISEQERMRAQSGGYAHMPTSESDAAARDAYASMIRDAYSADNTANQSINNNFTANVQTPVVTPVVEEVQKPADPVVTPVVEEVQKPADPVVTPVVEEVQKPAEPVVTPVVEEVQKPAEPVAIPKPKFCVHCGSALVTGDKFCGNCGKTVPGQNTVCAKCGNTLQPGVKFCDRCGTPVN
ncbi:MAG: S8 family serine peptidase [Clostridia bacterium]|nr:S8 family serine peptidase [Clostridia bacterium]